jgi:hypothetical protein
LRLHPEKRTTRLQRNREEIEARRLFNMCHEQFDI